MGGGAAESVALCGRHGVQSVLDGGPLLPDLSERSRLGPVLVARSPAGSPWLETFQIGIGESLGESIDESIVSECGAVDRGCAHAASVLPCSDTQTDGTYALVERSHLREVEVTTITCMRRILDFLTRAHDDRGDVPGWAVIELRA